MKREEKLLWNRMIKIRKRRFIEIGERETKQKNFLSKTLIWNWKRLTSFKTCCKQMIKRASERGKNEWHKSDC